MTSDSLVQCRVNYFWCDLNEFEKQTKWPPPSLLVAFKLARAGGLHEVEKKP